METSILRAFLFVAAAASVAVAVEPSAAPLDAWVIVGGAREHQMSGNVHDLARAHAAIGDGAGLWVRRDGHEWVVRDPKLLAQVRAWMAPLDELGRQQGAIGKKQGVLGEQQGELGRKMGELSRDAERNARQMEALGRQMEALGAKMEAFGKVQEELGGQMETAVRELQAKLATLVEEARAAGLASEVKEPGQK